MDYNLKITEVLQYILEPVQRQTNIILSLSAWLDGIQLTANTFSQTTIPENNYLGNIVSSKGAFEWYLNNEFNIATYSAYQPIFIDTLAQETLAMYGYNNEIEFEYDPLYFLQRMVGFPNSVNSNGVTYYISSATYSSQKMVWFGQPSGQTILYTFQNFGTQSISPNTPPVINGVISNTNKWQLATYGFNDLNAQSTSEDYDFIVWCPTYLNVSGFEIRITAYVEKYKLAHLNFVVRYY
jgi:hypothetical protein